MTRSRSPLLGAALLAVLFPLTRPSAQLGFSAVGPVDPVNGFPSSYTDTTGLSLAPCLADPILCGLLSPLNAPVAGQPFPANYGGTFPVELFYSRCVAKMNTTGTSLATLVVALEGSFLNGNVVLAGDQTTFARVRIRVQGLVAGQTYTVTTPVGIFTFVATNGSINNTDQAGGLAAGDFLTALSGHSGPFLRWDTGLPLFDAAGNEYIGNFGLDHTITGSPAGTNFFRIDGPSVGGPGVNRIETNLFGIVGMKAGAPPPPPPPAPVAQFSAVPVSGPPPLNVAFSDLSTGTITSWSWNFGDGTSSTLQNPSHTYALGSYAVSLQVTGPGGTNTMLKPAFIQVTNTPPPPVANFSSAPNAGTAPLSVAFTDLSAGTVASWLWSFGDGTTSTLQNPTHVYGAGTFSVSLTVTGAGSSSTLTKAGLVVVTAVAGAPVANFSSAPNSGTAPLNVSFTDSSTGTISARLWSFGDGTTSSLSNPTHSYGAGTFSVSLTVTGPGGSNTLAKANLIAVTVPPPPPTGLTLANPVPGIAGVPNTLTVTGARPNSVVGFYSGQILSAGILRNARCPLGIPIGLGAPFRSLGTARANAAGVATRVTTPPAGARGKVFHFQAVEPASCSASNVVSATL